jgi:CDP-glycerol glycerophosphotransferase (TagB/SpsB family)
MEDFKSTLEDEMYLTQEMQDLLKRFKDELPDEYIRICSDLIYHLNNSIKESEEMYEQYNNETRDSSPSSL